MSEGGGRAATQARPHAGAALPHRGAAAGLGAVLGGAVPGSRCPDTLGCAGSRAAVARSASRPAGSVGMGSGRAAPPSPAAADAELAHGEMAAGGSTAQPAPAGPRRSAVPEAVVTGREAGNAKLVQDWKPKNLCPRRKRLLFHCVPVSWN